MKITLRLLLASMIFYLPTYVNAETLRLAAFGDSLFAGNGLLAEHGFIPRLQKVLDDNNLDVEALNVVIGGHTSDIGVKRLNQLLIVEPDAVLLGYVANDIIRNYDPEFPKENYITIIETLQQNDVAVLLNGMNSTINWMA